MKYFYYTAVIFIGKKTFHIAGCCSTGGKEFPIWGINKEISEEKKTPFSNVHMTSWTEISKSEYEKMDLEYSKSEQ